MATISVITGMKVGIRRLSEICFGLGLFIMLVVFFYDDTWYILNVFVQSVGYYLQYILQLGFHCGEKFEFILYLSSACHLTNFYLHMSDGNVVQDLNTLFVRTRMCDV